MFYFRSNYKWYLKKVLPSQENFAGWVWTSSTNLIVIYKNKFIETLTL